MFNTWGINIHANLAEDIIFLKLPVWSYILMVKDDE